MTIGVGFHCIDGVALFADTQITFPANHKYYERKIYSQSYSHACSVAFTYAGNPDLMKMFYGKFHADMDGLLGKAMTVPIIQETIETVLANMDLVATDSDGLFMLCGIVASSNMVLLKTDRQIVRKVDHFDYVGCGDSSVLRYLSPLLITSRRVTTAYAQKAATYLIRQAKRYVDGCGGETTGHVLLKNGDNVMVAHVEELENRLTSLQGMLWGVGRLAFDAQDSDSDMDTRLEQLKVALRNERKELIR